MARVLKEVAAMLELAGENPFKIRAYETAAEAIAGFSGDLAEAVRTGRLQEIRGIGTAIFANVQTLLSTGRLPLQEELQARFPPGLSECLRLPGLGAKKIKRLHDLLGIDSLETLERACREGTLEAVSGFGARSAEKILQSIATRRAGAGFHRLPRALALAAELSAALTRTGGAQRVEIAGSLRRRREIVRDIDLVAASSEPAGLAAQTRTLAGVAEVTPGRDGVSRIRLAAGVSVDLTAVPAERFGAAFLWATGSHAHLEELERRAGSAGLALNAGGLFPAGADRPIAAATEEEIYGALALAWIPPELREGSGEIEAAAGASLPRLVEESDLRGLIHIHSTDSDGRASLETMIDAVREAGYEYVAITDHSKSAGYAHGLNEERVILQRTRLRALARRHPEFRVFHGTEADILADGSIDFGDGFLEGFDLVVASVHSRFGLTREEQTRRLVRAVRNPRVSVLGHPSGRLLLSREPLLADWDAVLGAAADSGCAVEINCNPQRLDLDWRLCRQAAEAGVLLSIDPDAHSVEELGLVPYGIGLARKGWITPASVLNAKSADELAQWLVRRRGKPLP